MKLNASTFLEVQRSLCAEEMNSLYGVRSCVRFEGAMSIKELPFIERDDIRELFRKYFVADRSTAFIEIYCLNENEPEQLNEKNLVPIKGFFSINTEEMRMSFKGVCALKPEVWNQLASEALTSNGLLSLHIPTADAGEVNATFAGHVGFKSQLSLQTYSWTFNNATQPK